MNRNDCTSTHDQTVGVLGGMGPAATHRFFDLIIDKTPATTDQEHLRVVIDNNPKIPDRAKHLVGSGDDPVPILIKGLHVLETSGADLITIPCNTAHAFIDELRAEADVPILDMIALTAEYVGAGNEMKDVGLLATQGTIESEIYHEQFENTLTNIIIPDKSSQKEVTMAIHEIKAGKIETPQTRLLKVVENLPEVDGVIMGCTETPIALGDEVVDVPVIDPMKILAEEAVRIAKQ